MARVASNILIDSLKCGRIVDTITIYGLLVSYNKEDAVALKYLVDFSNNTYTIQVGQKDFFEKLICLVLIGLGSN